MDLHITYSDIAMSTTKSLPRETKVEVFNESIIEIR